MVAGRAQCAATEENIQIEKKHPQMKKTSSLVSQHTCAPNTHNTTKYRNVLQITKTTPAGFPSKVRDNDCVMDQNEMICTILCFHGCWYRI